MGDPQPTGAETPTLEQSVPAVLPGWIATAWATDAERAAGRATPVGRPGTPDEMAAALAPVSSWA